MDGGEAQGAEDPFDGLSLDERWVAGAEVREPSARSRSTRAEIRKLEADRKAQVRAAQRRERRGRTFRRVAAAVGVLLFIGAVAVANDDGENQYDWSSGLDLSGKVTLDRVPTPKSGAAEPLGTPAEPNATAGTFEFLHRQPNGKGPVAYDPCRPIAMVVNERTMPEGAEGLLAEAVATVSKVSGLQIEIEGRTDENPSLGRDPFQESRYGDEWAPVLVSWSDPSESTDLADAVAGSAGSLWYQPPGFDEPRVYVTGVVTLDGPQIAKILDQDEGRAQARAVIVHELGHLVGLDHVDDADELMYPEHQAGVNELRRGDRAGLTRLGQGECVDRL